MQDYAIELPQRPWPLHRAETETRDTERAREYLQVRKHRSISKSIVSIPP